TFADDLINADLLVVEGVVNFLLVFGEFDGREDASFVWRGWAVGCWEKIFEFAEDVFGALAEFGALFNQFVAAFASRCIYPAWAGALSMPRAPPRTPVAPTEAS